MKLKYLWVEKTNFINPDIIYDEEFNGITFIYDPQDNELYTETSMTPHTELIDTNQQLSHKIQMLAYGNIKATPSHILRNQAEEYMLVGRAAIIDKSTHQMFERSPFPTDKLIYKFLHDKPTLFMISFWNVGNDKEMRQCVTKVLDAYKVPSGIPIYISTPLHGVFALGAEQIQQELSRQERENIELQKKLHLMKPAEKKRAMAKLGLTRSSSKNKWQREAEKVGITSPGNKWWTSSESKK